MRAFRCDRRCVLHIDVIITAQLHAEADGGIVDVSKIGFVCETVLADFKLNMRVVIAALAAGTAPPRPHIPWERLVDPNIPIFVFANEGVDADAEATMVSVVIVLVFTDQTVVWLNISA